MPCADGALGGTAFDPTTYTRKIQLIANDRVTLLETLCDYSDSSVTNVVEDAEFELLRQGGCGAGTFKIAKEFDDTVIQVGMFIRCWYKDTDIWYSGRVEEVSADDPSGQMVRTYGPMGMLGEVPVGGLGQSDLRKPHLIANLNAWPNDPDRAIQSWEVVNTVTDVVQSLYDGYILPETSLALASIENPAVQLDYGGTVFRGEEMLDQVIRGLAVQQYGASYGVTPEEGFYFINPRFTGLARFQQGVHCTELSRSSDQSLLMNRIYIVGDNVYEETWAAAYAEQQINEIFGPVRPYRYQEVFRDDDSIDLYGVRSRLIHLPWVRQRSDAQIFAQQLLEDYATPFTRYTFTTTPQGALLRPWEGWICLLDESGSQLNFSVFDRIQVKFNEAPYFTITTGPEDLQFPEPPERQRWELPDKSYSLSLTLDSSASSSSSVQSSDAPSDDQQSSDAASSDDPSDNQQSSDGPSSDAPSSDAPSSDAPSSDAPSSDETSRGSDYPSSNETSRGSDYPSSDAPSSDAPSSDAPSSDAPSSDATSSNFPSSDAPSSDALSSDAPSSDECDCIEVVTGVACENGELVVYTTSVCVTRCGQ